MVLGKDFTKGTGIPNPPFEVMIVRHIISSENPWAYPLNAVILRVDWTSETNKKMSRGYRRSQTGVRGISNKETQKLLMR
jgi:hypothetical protein